MLPQSPKYSSDSLGSRRWISPSTDRPPTPESNTPIGASRMSWPADTAAWITLDPQFAKARTQGIDQQQAPHQRFAKADQQFQRLKGLQATDQTHQRTEHAGFTAGQFGF